MDYVDGLVLPVAKKNLPAFIAAWAQEGGARSWPRLTGAAWSFRGMRRRRSQRGRYGGITFSAAGQAQSAARDGGVFSYIRYKFAGPIADRVMAKGG